MSVGEALEKFYTFWIVLLTPGKRIICSEKHYTWNGEATFIALEMGRSYVQKGINISL